MKLLLAGIIGCLLFTFSCAEEELLKKARKREKVTEFFQVDKPEVDILWVVDNSGSMLEKQNALANSFETFIKAMDEQAQKAGNKAVSFRQAVVTTDVTNENNFGGQANPQTGACQGGLKANGYQFVPGKNGKPYVDSTDPGATDDFKTRVKVGTCGNYIEKGLDAALNALYLSYDSNHPNFGDSGFMRPGAALLIIFVTDEDDASPGLPYQYYRQFKQIKGVGNSGLVGFAAVVAINGPCTAVGPEKKGVRYQELLKFYDQELQLLSSTNQGSSLPQTVLNICDSNFQNNLANLGRLVQALKDVFGPVCDLSDELLDTTSATRFDSINTLKLDYPCDIPKTEINCPQGAAIEDLCTDQSTEEYKRSCVLLDNTSTGDPATNAVGTSVFNIEGIVGGAKFIRFTNNFIPGPRAKVSMSYVPSDVNFCDSSN